jgi:hypothetical protein
VNFFRIRHIPTLQSSTPARNGDRPDFGNEHCIIPKPNSKPRLMAVADGFYLYDGMVLSSAHQTNKYTQVQGSKGINWDVAFL